MARLPKKWTAEEDDTLRREVESQRPDGRDWCHIAEKLPGRTNKDCRKRWHNTMAGEFRKGPWAKQEDEQLKKAIAKHGTRWTIVASGVKTRSAEQCAKRWQHSLNPDLDRSEWTETEDRTLIEAVNAVGRQWTQIQGMYFAERSKNAIKNRYTIVSRKLRRLAQGTQVSAPTAPDGASHDEDSDDDDDMGEDDPESDRDERGPAWSSPLQSRSQSGPSTTDPHNVLSDPFWNQFYPTVGGAQPSMYDVAPVSSSNPWTWESSQLITSDPFPQTNDSTLRDAVEVLQRA
ncbi:Homeodomain-like protein [Aspergillus lucknowensis]|uniref:Homeodomain-like protein n=1 Tax=Aspergillus lucknowensis TaxID=176173 RepID=A0ABR4LXH0_9EURO